MASEYCSVTKARSFRYVYEAGRHYIVISQGGTEDFIRLELDPRQVSGFIEDALPRVLRK